MGDDFIDYGDGTTLYRRINISNTITFVDTTIDFQARVLLSNSTNIGEIYTVKDTGGSASYTTPIVISTITTTSFSDPSVSNYQIQQPFGYMSFISINSSQWSILNTFTNNTGSSNTESTIENPQVNSIIFNDSVSIGETPIVNVNNGILELNGSILENIDVGINNIVATNLLVLSNISVDNLTISNVNYIPASISGKNQVIAIGNGNINISYDATTWTTPLINTLPTDYIEGKYLTIKGDNIIGLFWYFNDANRTTFKLSIQTTNSIQRTDGANIWKELYLSDNFNRTDDPCALKCGTQYNMLSINNQLYYSTTLSGPWIGIVPSLSQDAFDTDGNNFVIYSDSAMFLYIRNNFNMFNIQHLRYIESFEDIITTIKYSPNCNGFMLYSLKRVPPSFTRKIYFLTSANIQTGIPTRIQNLTNYLLGNSLNAFVSFDAYINEGTIAEIGLPTVIYFGRNDNGNSNIAYTYGPDIYNQTNFNFIATPPTPITTYTITNGVFYVASSNIVITLDSNNFIDPIANPPILRSTSLAPINSIISRNYVVPNSETLLEVSGTLQTNFLTLTGNSCPDAILTRSFGDFAINKNLNNIKAFLEIKYNLSDDPSSSIPKTTNIYPIGLNVENVGGLFMPDNNIPGMSYIFKRSITAVILEPGYIIQIYNETNFQGGYIERINTTFYPIHINIDPTILVPPNAADTPFSCRLSRINE